jgi:predicted GTPase
VDQASTSNVQQQGEEEDEEEEGVREEQEGPLRLAILGLPNVGKSTLMNSLLGYERSLTGDCIALDQPLGSSGSMDKVLVQRTHHTRTT